jgi:beta-xylosidase
MGNNYFKELNKIECATEKKNNLTYVSWSDAWTKVKEQHPQATYTIYENADGFPFWESKFGIDCKVGVTIN